MAGVVAQIAFLTKLSCACFVVCMSRSSVSSSPACQARQVWASNFDAEFSTFVSHVNGLRGCVLAFDVEFPGFFEDSRRGASRDAQYQALRSNVNLLNPVQLGIAVANQDGVVVGLWDFNLHFDIFCDLHMESAVALLSDAGLDFARHRFEGISRAYFQRQCVELLLPTLDRIKHRCQFVTFAGAYDYAYLIKLLTGPSLPSTVNKFLALVDGIFPCRCELRDRLPYGSLGSLASEFGVLRHGPAHAAASDALVTLRLYRSTVVVEGCAVLPGLAAHADCFQVPTTMFRLPPGLCVAMPLVDVAGNVPFCDSRAKDASCHSWGKCARWESCRASGKVPPPHVWCAAAREAAVACVC